MMPERALLAELDVVQIKALSALEEQLGVTLVAYETPMHDDDHIVESEV
ncbi:hypothetical protein [Sporosarcina koreensis]|uniref:Uncharacterized protein n=1 Tax=Sporosarcina koreensis TaxID=334735 RepID=A0ABW0TTV8_9BACL